MKTININAAIIGEAGFTAKGKDKKTSALAVKNAVEYLDNRLATDKVMFSAFGTLENGETRAITTEDTNEAMNWLKENE